MPPQPPHDQQARNDRRTSRRIAQGWLEFTVGIHDVEHHKNYGDPSSNKKELTSVIY
jgi:hypothetical protein